MYKRTSSFVSLSSVEDYLVVIIVVTVSNYISNKCANDAKIVFVVAT